MHRSDVYINRIRLKTTQQGPRINKRRLRHVLESSGWYEERGGVPPSAVMMIQSLQDPLPGQLHSQRQGERVNPVWLQAARRSLRTLYASAERPRRGRIASGAQVICFADIVELQACFAMAGMYRGIADQWWWRLIASRYASSASGVGSLIVRSLEEHIQHAPAALALANSWGYAREVVRSMPASGVERVLQELITTYAIPVSTPHENTTDNAPSALLHSDKKRGVDFRSVAPGDLFLETCLLLQNHPGARLVPERWHRLLREALVRSKSTRWPFKPAGRAEPLVGVDEGDTTQIHEHPSMEEDEDARKRADPVLLYDSDADENIVSDQGQSVIQRQGSEGAASEADPVGALPPSVTESSSEQVPESVGFDDGSFVTKWGGVFYLVNLVAYIDAHVRVAEQAMNPWALVLELVKTWIDTSQDRDPVWTWLADVAGTDTADAPLIQAVVPEAVDSLYKALGETRQRGPDRIRQLLATSARLYVTSSHIDVMYALDAIDLDLRMAGLDRNPGWQPLFGYVITFHFTPEGPA